MARWLTAPDVAPPSDALLALVDQESLVAEVLARRGFGDLDRARAFLDPAAYSPALPTALPGLEKAANLLIQAIEQKQTILVWGDFDVDGQTASALLIEALRPLTEVRLHIPDRARDGHGIGVEALESRIQADSPAVLLTCDTGITAHAAIDCARSRGLVTIITDHHDLPPSLPDADAIINPKLLPTAHPLATLPGVGVAYKLIQHLHYLLDRDKLTSASLDLVGLGIVADVAEQVGDTRYLLQIGLERLRRTERPGLRALFEVAKLNPSALDAEQIGFQLGPRLNAAGRLGDALLAVELLTTRERSRLPILAAQLEGLNQKRRQLQREMEAAAQTLIADAPDLLDYAGLVLFDAGWQAGLLGPVAGRLAEKYARPVILLSALNEQTARGSARSAGGYDIQAALAAVADRLISFGGHPGAAGVTLTIEAIPDFRRALSVVLNQQPNQAEPDTLQIEARLPFESITPSLAAALNRLAPFGEGNPQPIWMTERVRITQATYLDRQHEHRRLTVQDANGLERIVYWWNSGGREPPNSEIDLAFTLRLTPAHEVELTLVDQRLHDLIGAVPRIGPRLIDLRAETAPLERLAQLRAEAPNLSVWAEGYAKAESPGLPRHALQPGCPLAILSTPPIGGLLNDLIARLEPPEIYVFGLEPPNQQPRDFVRQLAGIAEFVINRQDGRIDLATLCARTAQSESVIRAALEIVPRLAVDWRSDQELHLSRAEPREPDADRLAEARLLLDESRAYRAYFRRAPLLSVFNGR